MSKKAKESFEFKLRIALNELEPENTELLDGSSSSIFSCVILLERGFLCSIDSYSSIFMKYCADLGVCESRK